MQVKLEPESSVADVAGGESECTVVKELSTPAKRVAECVVIGEVTAQEKAESKKRKKNYDLRRHFQDSWAAKLPWAEAVVGCDGSITQVRCKICSNVEAREKLMVPKIDSLYKHAGRRKAMVDMGKVRRGEYFYGSTLARINM
ncbi:hypothetical protein M758_7G128500 [Ceratodon purpureus]|nr:hypothetical protein M758_7G128500 [Ceratodon purpureus]